MAGSEIEEVNRRLSQAAVAVIQAATAAAEALLAARAAQLRAAAAKGQEQARRTRDQVAAARRNDNLLWRPALSEKWLRAASIHDIARAYAAAHAWQTVDPAAAQAVTVMAARLREVDLPVDTASRAEPGDTAWVRTAADLADAQRAATTTDGVTPDRAQPLPVADADRDRLAELVRAAALPAETATSLLESPASPALAYRLDEHASRGGNPTTMLGRLDLAGARDPAALAAWQVQRATLDLAQSTSRQPTTGGEPSRTAETTATAGMQPNIGGSLIGKRDRRLLATTFPRSTTQAVAEAAARRRREPAEPTRRRSRPRDAQRTQR